MYEAGSVVQRNLRQVREAMVQLCSAPHGNREASRHGVARQQLSLRRTRLSAAGYSERVVKTSQLQSNQLDVQWRARWMPRQLQWLEAFGNAWPGVRVQYYDLLDRYDQQSEFRWRALFNLFARAVQTGVLRIPESAIEGTLSLTVSTDGRIEAIRERIGLVPLFRNLKVKNRRLARDMLLWQEMRQPADVSYSKWDEMVMSDMLLEEVPGMGQFEVDGLDADGRDNAYASVFLVMAFAFVVLISFGVSYGMVHMQQSGAQQLLFDRYPLDDLQ